MVGAFCPWCGAAGCGRCRRPPYEAPRYCRRCGRLLRVTVHPLGWESKCRCGAVAASPGSGLTTGGPAGA